MMTRRYPAELGFRMPAEWSPHFATILAWPHNTDTWPNNLCHAQDEFTQLVRAIAADEPVFILADPGLHQEIQGRLNLQRDTAHPVSILGIPTNDAWVRDYGPTFVSNGSALTAVDWRYNAWGGKYPPFDDDQQAVHRFVELNPDYHRFESSLFIEGGAIEIDADPIVMCTRSCALNPNRNSMSQGQIEIELQRCLGAKAVIWLNGDGIAGDDTDGHIDQLARFVPGNRILVATAARSDQQFEALNQNRTELLAELERLDLKYELVELPLPDPVVAFGSRLPASYCNYYVTNQSVMVPLFGQSGDEIACDIISACFKNRKVVGLPSVNLSVGLGSFHCLTQQIPSASLSKRDA